MAKTANVASVIRADGGSVYKGVYAIEDPMWEGGWIVVLSGQGTFQVDSSVADSFISVFQQIKESN